MTVCFYIHSITKRAESVALLNSGATENFMNLSYSKWLRLPIKQLERSRKLFNADGTENKSGELRYYTDLNVRTGHQTTSLCFFLTDLGDHKAILGYSWFAAVQPNIDWKRGWTDHTQLPIIFCTPNAKGAVFTPRTRNVPREVVANQYFIGCVTFHNPTTSSTPNPRVPEEYQCHGKVFSEEESQCLPQHTVWDHAIELLPGAPHTLPGRLLPLTQAEIAETHKFIEEHLERNTIRKYIIPYAGYFFFVKKKDGNYTQYKITGQ